MYTTNLPIGTQDFEKLRTSNMVYVDKTREIYELVATGDTYFFARPRRFGKSLLCSTLKELFLGNRELFKGLWIDQSDWEWKKHPVIHLDLSKIPHKTPEKLGAALNKKLKEIARDYQVIIEGEEPGELLDELINALKSLGKVVLIIDEYDKPVVDALHNLELTDAFRLFFKSFYQSLKANGEHLRFLFITGISQFAKMSIFSELNHLFNLSNSAMAATLCGYTQQELEDSFSKRLQHIATKFGCSYQEILATTKLWYNGYCFATPGPNIQRVYNPFSIINFCKDGEYNNYWFATGTPSFVIEFFKQHQFIVPDFERVSATRSTLTELIPSSLNLTTMLYQAGYLTIQGHRADAMTYTLGFPNYEVANACSGQLFNYLTKQPIDLLQNATADLRIALMQHDLDNIKPSLAQIFAHIPYPIKPANENGYQMIFYLVLRMLGLNTIVEEPTSIGRIDAVVRTPQRIFIVEFKIRGSAKDALEQIKDRRYSEKYVGEGLPITLIGILFDPDPKARTVTEVLWEEYVSPIPLSQELP